MFKRSFWEVGQWLQDTAKTEEEAKKRFQDSCSRCNKQAFCNEKFCPIAKTHEVKLLCLEADKLRGTRKAGEYLVKTRAYRKLSPEEQTRKQLKRYFHKLYEMVTNRKVELVLDQASVSIELLEFGNALVILRKAGLEKVAEQVQTIVSKIKED